MTLIVSGGPASAPVTDVEGLSEQEALKKLRKAGFKPRVTKQASSTVASGKVIGTNPPAGGLEQLGSGVEVLVSSGPAPVTVPDVTGQSLSAAEATLANAGLELGTVTKRETTEQQPGTVLSQSPSNGTSVKAKSKVDLVVAQGTKEVRGAERGRREPGAREEHASNRRASGSRRRRVRPPKPSRSARCCARAAVPARRPTKGTTVTVDDRPARHRNDDHDHHHPDHADDPGAAGLGRLSWRLPMAPQAPSAAAGEGASLRVAVLAGGRSSEHDVSLASGAAVRDALLEAGHDAVPDRDRPRRRLGFVTAGRSR